MLTGNLPKYGIVRMQAMWLRTGLALGRWWVLPLLCGLLLSELAAAQSVTAQNGLSCAGYRFSVENHGQSLKCTAGEFLTTVTITSGADSCVSGDYYYLTGNISLVAPNTNRYDIGFFVGENGNDPLDGASVASGAACSVATFPTSPFPWFDGDNGANPCGDFTGKQSATPSVSNLKVRCEGNAAGQLAIPYVVTYRQKAGNVCTGPSDVTSGTTSKCNAGVAYVPGVTVLPAPAVSAFNAFESTVTASALAGPIYTKLAGTAFSLDVVAISGGGKATGFNGNVRVELLANTGTPGSGYGADNCPTSNTVILTLPANPAIAGGRSTVNFPAVANAYQDVRVRISYPVSLPTTTVCSTDSFAIRPSGLILVPTANASGPSAVATPTVKAGTAFGLYGTTASGSNYSGTLTLDSSKLTAQDPGSITRLDIPTVGTLSPTTIPVNAAVPPSSNAVYSEVGYLYLAAGAYRDSAYTSVDQAAGDCVAGSISDTLSADNKYGCWIGNQPDSLGRFIPHHFDVVVAPQCGGFAYSGRPASPAVPGQPFTVQATAMSGMPAPQPTTYYAGLFAKDVNLTLSAGGSVGALYIDSNPGGTGGVPAGKFAGGVGKVNFNDPSGKASFVFNSFPAPPADIKIHADDSETAPSTGTDGGPLSVRAGRLWLANAYGSELLPLPVPVQTQYWTGSYWATSLSDNCTSLTTPSAGNGGLGNALQNRTTVIAPISVSNGKAVSLGKDSLTLTAPGAGNAGVVDIIGSVLRGPSTWLDLSAATARACFGRCGPRSQVIYLRERY